MRQIYSIWLYGRTILFVLLFFPPMIAIALLVPSLMYQYAQFLSKGIFWSFNIKRNIIGEFPDDGPYILMHNHTSFLDLFFLPTVIKGKYTGIVAAKNFKIPIIGSILYRIHAIPIHRFNHTKAINSMKIAEKKIQEGYHIAIFPEGTRTTTGDLNTFKKGGFHMAINTQTKILPVITQGLYSIKPKTRWTIHPGEATMIIKNPISTTDKTVEELLEEVRSIYLQYDLK